eukprot:gene5249-20912_t
MLTLLVVLVAIGAIGAASGCTLLGVYRPSKEADIGFSGRMWGVTDSNKVVLYDMDERKWTSTTSLSTSSLCSQHGCGFEGIASIPSQPDYLYLVAEFETADSGSTQRSSRMYKYSIAQDRLVDSCKLK